MFIRKDRGHHFASLDHRLSSPIMRRVDEALKEEKSTEFQAMLWTLLCEHVPQAKVPVTRVMQAFRKGEISPPLLYKELEKIVGEPILDAAWDKAGELVGWSLPKMKRTFAEIAVSTYKNMDGGAKAEQVQRALTSCGPLPQMVQQAMVDVFGKEKAREAWMQARREYHSQRPLDAAPVPPGVLNMLAGYGQPVQDDDQYKQVPITFDCPPWMLGGNGRGSVGSETTDTNTSESTSMCILS